MTLHRQSWIFAWMTGLVVAAMLAIVGASAREVEQRWEQMQMAENTVKGLTQLRLLIVETMLYQEPRARAQWQQRIASFRTMLATHAYGKQIENALLVKQKTNLETLVRLYDNLIAADTARSAKPYQDITAKEISSEWVSAIFRVTQEMIDDAFELVRLNRASLETSQNRAGWSMLLSMLTLGLLIVTAAIGLQRGVLAPIAMLQRLTEQISSGDLTLRLKLGLANEIGVLADTFDTMTERLQQAQKAMHEENAERRLAQCVLKRTIGSLAAKSAALALAQKELQTIIDHMPALVVYWDSKLLNRFANKAYIAWFGKTPEQMHGKHIREIIGDERYREIEPQLRSVLQGHAELFERTLLSPSGQHLHALFSYVPDVENGVVKGLYGIITDISPLKQAQAIEAKAQAQIAALALLQSTVDAARDFAIIVTDVDGLITLFSKGAQCMLGHTAAQMVGQTRPPMIYLAAEVRARGLELSQQHGRAIHGFDVFVDAARRDESESHEWTYIRSDGSLLPVNQTVTAARGPDGAIIGFLGIAQDISADKARVQALADALDQAQAANVAKNEFLANMSHEIRTPMNAILGLLQLLQNTELSTLQRGYARKTHAAARSLLALLNDILDLSKIEATKLTLECAPFSINTLLDELAEILLVSLGGKDLALRLKLDPRIPAWLKGDALRLRQVLLNLACNAIKFTQHGEVIISLQCQSSTEQHTIIAFNVIDTGIGIAREHLASIFEQFSQAEASTTRRFGGTGLGLAISRQLVELMGGKLDVDSVAGAGSTFFFSVTFVNAPLATMLARSDLWARMQHQNRIALAAPSACLSGLHLLIVDDNPLNLQVAQELLQSEGASVDVARDGASALKMAGTAEPPFDAVLMDIQMPGMDGIETTRRMRADARMLSVPIIAMTANVMDSDKDACMAAGMNDHIGKPIDLALLVQALLRHCAGGGLAQGRFAPIDRLALPAPDAINVTLALQRLGGNRALFNKLVRFFCADASTFVSAFEANLHAARWSDAVQQLHTFKSAAGTVGADLLANHAAALEAQLHLPAAVSNVDSVMEKLKQMIDQTVLNLHAIEANIDVDVDVETLALSSEEPGAAPRTLVEMLDELDVMLQDANLRAVGVFAAIERHYSAALGPHLAPLALYMDRLDFKGAAQCSRSLRASVR